MKPDSLESRHAWFFKFGPVKYELYNIIDDPQQRIDLAAKKPETVSSLSLIMSKLWIEMRDEGLKKNINNN